MANSIDICNLALSLLGEEPSIVSIDPPDGSDNAGHCQRFYPLAVRKLHEEFDWSFAQKRVKLSELNYDTEKWGVKHVYAMPSDCVRIVKVYVPDEHLYMPIDSTEWRVEYNEQNSSRMILTDVDGAYVHYTALVSSAAIYPTYFVEALTILLAAYLVGPVKRESQASQQVNGILQRYAQALSAAKSIDSQATGKVVTKYIPSSIRSRWG